MNLEEELFDAFDGVVHQDYANPQRINCPGYSAALRGNRREDVPGC